MGTCDVAHACGSTDDGPGIWGLCFVHMTFGTVMILEGQSQKRIVTFKLQWILKDEPFLF